MRGRELRARGGDLPPLSVFCVCVWLPTPLTRRHAGRNEPRTDAALCGEKSWKSGFRRTTTQPWPSDLASMAPAHTANLTRDTTTDQKTLPRAHQSAPRAHQTDVVFPPRSDGDPFPTCVTVEVGRPIAGTRVLGAEMFVPRAGLSARQPNVPSRRSASPIAEARSPKAAPSGSTSRSLQTPCPRFFLASQVCQTLAIQSLRARDSAAESERRFLLCAHNASVAMVDLGTLLTYRGRLHVVVGVTPMGATPRLLELEDVESGRIRRVEWTDPGLDTSPGRASDREDPPDEQASD